MTLLEKGDGYPRNSLIFVKAGHSDTIWFCGITDDDAKSVRWYSSLSTIDDKIQATRADDLEYYCIDNKDSQEFLSNLLELIHEEFEKS